MGTWNDTTGAWSVAGNWTGTAPAAPGGAATVLQFGAGAADYTSTFDLGAAFQLNALRFTTAPGRTNAVVASAGANTLDLVADGATAPQVNLVGGGTVRIGNNVRVAAGTNLTLNVDATSNLVFSGAATPAGTATSITPVSGSSSTVTVEGGGTVVWRSITTNIAVNNGLVTTDADGDFLGSGALSVGAKGVVDTGGFAEGWASITGVAGATFRGNVSVNAAGGTFRYDGVITNRPAGGTVAGFGTVGGAASNGAITKSGGHTLIVSGASTFSGTTSVTGGTLVYAGDPVTSGASGGFATGTITSSPFGTGTLSLGGGTLSVDASRTIVNPTTIAAGSSTVNVPAGFELTNTGTMTYTGTVTKTGPGLWRIAGGNGSANAASVMNVNEGTVLLTDVTTPATGGDMNVTALNVNSGGTFVFGSNPAYSGENPDLPNTTYINVNTGGTVVWNVGEDYGGINLLGGAIQMRGNINIAGVTASELRSGTIAKVGGTPGIGGAQTLNKTTADTVTITGVPLNNTGGLNIQEGVLSTDSAIASTSGGTAITALVTFGTATTAGTLRYTGTGTAASVVRTVQVNAGGGTIEVTDPAAALTLGGPSSGAGALAKAGPGTLVLSASNAYTGGTTVSGGTLQVGAGGTAGSIVGNVATAAGTTLAFNRSDDVTYAGNVSGGGALTKLGAGALTMTGALTHTGPTTVGGGTLRIAPATLAGGVTVADGATLAVANPAGTAGTLTVPTLALGAGGSTLRFELDRTGNPTAPLLNVTGTDGLNPTGGSHTLVVTNKKALSVGTFTLVDYAGSPISSGFTLAPLSARSTGQLVYNAANTRIDLQVTSVDSVRWNGSVNANWNVGSDVNVGGTANFKLASNGTDTNFVQNDVVLFNDAAAGPGGTTVTVAESVQPAAVTVDNAAKPYTFQGAAGIDGPGTLTKQGAGALTVLTNNTFAGGTTVAAGTLNVGSGGTTGDLGTGPIVNNGAVVWNRSDDVTLAQPISGTGSLTKAGANTLVLTGAFTQSGPTTVAGGTLVLDAATDYAAPSAIGGAGALVKRGAGTVSLTGAATPGGGTSVEAGTLKVGAGGTTGSLAGSVSLNGAPGANGTLAFDRSDTYTFAGNITVGGAGTTAKVINVGPGNTILTGTITQPSVTQAGTVVAQAGTLTLANPNTAGLLGTVTAAAGATVALDTTAGDQTYNNAFAGQGTVAKVGPGTATITFNNNPFTGTLRVDAGTLVQSDPTGSGGDLGATSIVVNSGGTYQFGGAAGGGENPDLPDTTFVTVNPGGNVVWRIGENIGGVHLQGGTITLESGNITANGVSESWTSGTLTSLATAQAVGGGAVINKTTSGTVTITGLATVGSVLNIQDGTVAFATAANLGTAALQLGVAGTGGTTGTIEYQGATATRSANVALNGPGAVRVTQAAAALTLSGVLSGAGNLTKDGPGTLVLTGTNTYTGGTSVAAGLLMLNGQTGNSSGTGTGAVTVGAGGAVGGTGSITGTLSVAGAVRPGNGGVGKLTAGATTLNAGAAWQVEMSDAAGTAGVAWDLLQGRTGASLTVGATPASPVVLQLVSVDGAGAPAAAGNFNPSQAYAWTIASYPGGVAAFDPAAVRVSLVGFANPANGGAFAVASTGNDVVLTFTPVPEPGTVGAVGLAAVGLLARRRRRRH
ncbi:MAG TPA: autotransporter-associated beta strand repeat-containing protein [Humisphaera sp.]